LQKSVDCMPRSPVTEIINEAGQLLRRKYGFVSADIERIIRRGYYQKIAADGSGRQFLRLCLPGFPSSIIVAPAATSAVEMAESRAMWEIGRHLHGAGVPVPEIYGWQQQKGILLLEDLGDLRLHDIVVNSRQSDSDLDFLSYYRHTIKALVKMQICGARGFLESWCWDSPRYDAKVMIEKESNYFINGFWRGVLREKENWRVNDEFEDIVKRVLLFPLCFFIHRDFQSRNIMIKGGSVKFIDFQGGRFGPLGYDIASLLIDPYAGLSKKIREELLAYYIKIVEDDYGVDGGELLMEYRLLALQRNLQIIGAFSYLSREKGKLFFEAFLMPALYSLNDILGDEPSFSQYTSLRGMAKRGVAFLEKSI